MPHILHHKRAVLLPEISMGVVWNDSHDLVLMSKRCDQRADVLGVPQLIQEFQFILDSRRTTGHVNLFQRHVFLSPGSLRFIRVVSSVRISRRARTMSSSAAAILLLIPFVNILVVLQVFRFVDGGKGPLNRETRQQNRSSN